MACDVDELPSSERELNSVTSQVILGIKSAIVFENKGFWDRTIVANFKQCVANL